MSVFRQSGGDIRPARDAHMKSLQADGRLCVYDTRNREDAWIEGEYVAVDQ